MDDIIDELTKELANAPMTDMPVLHKRATTDPRFVFQKTDDELLLVYTPDKGARFIDERLSEYGEEGEELRIRGVFYFRRQDVKDIDALDASKRTFVLGCVTKEHTGYYKVESRMLGINVNLFIAKEVDVDLRWFEPLYVYDYGSVTVFDKINKVVVEDVFIGGDHESEPYLLILGRRLSSSSLISESWGITGICVLKISSAIISPSCQIRRRGLTRMWSVGRRTP